MEDGSRGKSDMAEKIRNSIFFIISLRAEFSRRLIFHRPYALWMFFNNYIL